MHNQDHSLFVSRLVRLLVSLVSSVSLVLVLLLLSSSQVSQVQAGNFPPLSTRSGWQQSNTSGFGTSANDSVDTLKAFGGQLYGGAANGDQGATLWRSADGVTWSLSSSPGFSSTYTNTNPVVFDLVEFNGQLFAGTGNWFNDGIGGQIWRSIDGANWTVVENNGFGDTNNAAVTTFAVFGNTLYAAVGGNTNGLQIWRSSTGDMGSWSRVVVDGNGDSRNQWITGFALFDGHLYAAIETTITSSVQIWQTDSGTTWTQVNVSGFGDTNNYQTGGMAVFNDYLYVGTRNDVTGAQIWRSLDGSTWTQAMRNGFGDINNYKVESLSVLRNDLYAVTDNDVTGLEVWRSQDGIVWSQDAPDGFGSDQTTSTLWSNATTVFANSLFIGVHNTAVGGQIWQRLHQVYLPLVLCD